MKKNLLPITNYILVLVFLMGFGCGSPQNSGDQGNQANNNQESDAGGSNNANGEWEYLFNGENMEHWRGFQKDASEPTGWEIQDGALYTSGGNGDIMTREKYGDFELVFEWKIEKGGNSGVIFHVAEEDYEQSYLTGPEYQLIDGENYETGSGGSLSKNQLTGSNYALHAPSSVPVKPAGEAYNKSRLIVNDGHVEHWLNGEKVVSYELGSEDWKERVKNSKFNEMPGYGQYDEGYIALQDHNHKIWFKNIKIREL